MSTYSDATLEVLLNTPSGSRNLYTVICYYGQNYINWVNAIKDQERLAIFLEYVICSTDIPDGIAQCPRNKAIIDQLAVFYMNPLSCPITVNYAEIVVSMTFSQFKVIHKFFSTRPEGKVMPLIDCPPEYWYLHSLIKAPEYHMAYIPTESSIRAANDSKRTYVHDCDVSGFFPDFLTKDMKVAASGKDKVYLTGSSTVPSFKLTDKAFGVTSTLYSAFPQYWDHLGKCKNTTPIANIVTAAVALHKESLTQAGGSEVTESFALSSFEAVISVGSSGAEEVLVEPTVAFVPNVELLEEYPVSEPEVLLPNCPTCTVGDASAACSFLEVVGPPDLESALDSVKETTPQLLSTLLHQSSDAQAFSVAFGSTSVLDGVREAEELASSPYVPEAGQFAVDGSTLHSYLKLEEKASPTVSPKFFSREDVNAIPIAYDPKKMRWSRNTTAKFPHMSFMKHAQLLMEMGFVTLAPDLTYPVGRYPGPESLRVYYPGGTSLGPVAAVLESGLAALVAMPQPRYCPIKDPPYLREEVPSFTFVHNEREAPYNYSTLANSLFQADQTSSYKRRGKMKPFKKYDLIIFDDKTPFDPTGPLTGKALGKISDLAELHEIPTKLPFKRDVQVTTRLQEVEEIISHMLELGGSLILRLKEIASPSTVVALSDVTSRFAHCRLVRSPYSPPLSGEFYFLGRGFQRKSTCDARLTDHYKLTASLTKFNTTLYWTLSRNLRLSYKRHVQLYHKQRFKACRCYALQIKGITLPSRIDSGLQVVPLYFVRQMPYYGVRELVHDPGYESFSTPMTYTGNSRRKSDGLSPQTKSWLISKFPTKQAWGIFKAQYLQCRAVPPAQRAHALSEMMRVTSIDPHTLRVLIGFSEHQLEAFNRRMEKM